MSLRVRVTYGENYASEPELPLVYDIAVLLNDGLGYFRISTGCDHIVIFNGVVKVSARSVNH